jgi:endonuclease/exonuclease/phosphatase family metal-dependent hydrolase
MGNLRVMTFNIRGAFHLHDGANAWANRAALNVATIKRYAPDLIGFQELQSGNLEIYREALPEYRYVVGPQADNEEPHNYNAIFWTSASFELIDSGGFWLSRTPDRYSSDWDTCCIRATNWVLLRHLATGLDMVHVNTHLDHISEMARVEGSRLILQQLEAIQPPALPTIITGDFNCVPGSPAYRLFLDDGFIDTYLAAGNEDTVDSHTFHGFAGKQFVPQPHSTPPIRIDWILLRDRAQRFQIRSSVIVHDEEPPLYPSDHYPVIADLLFHATTYPTPPTAGGD